MKGSRRAMARLVLAAGMLGATLPFAAGPATAGSATCVRTGDRITIEPPVFTLTTISRTAAGTILIDGNGCGGATVNNINEIRVEGDGESHLIRISLANGAFAPGLANETGGSDEIEFFLYMGGGFDELTIAGGRGVDRIRMGRASTSFGQLPRVNLNAGESSAVDADVYSVHPLWRITVHGSGGNDRISGAGGAGTGQAYGQSFEEQLELWGGSGADVLTGGRQNDYIVGGSGGDELRGGAGIDSLVGTDGVNGNDALDGGEDGAGCDADPGDSLVRCES